MFASSRSQKPGLWRYAMGFFVLVTCLRVWVGPAPVLESAKAQIPDSAQQRNQMIEAAKRTSELLAEIKHILASGTLNVRIAGADNTGTDKSAGVSK